VARFSARHDLRRSSATHPVSHVNTDFRRYFVHMYVTEK